MEDRFLKSAISRFKEVDALLREADSRREEWRKLKSFLDRARELFPEEFEKNENESGVEHGVSEGMDEVSMEDERPESPSSISPQGEAQPLVGLAAARQVNNSSADFAAKILRDRGPLKLEDLIKTMRATGWAGLSQSSQEEYRSLYRVLQARKTRFCLYGRSLWGLQDGPRPSAEQLSGESATEN